MISSREAQHSVMSARQLQLVNARMASHAPATRSIATYVTIAPFAVIQNSTMRHSDGIRGFTYKKHSQSIASPSQVAMAWLLGAATRPRTATMEEDSQINKRGRKGIGRGPDPEQAAGPPQAVGSNGQDVGVRERRAEVLTEGSKGSY